MRRLSLDDMEELARVATREAMTGWRIPDEVWSEVTLGSGIIDRKGDFVLYIPADIPSEGPRISRTIVSREGEVLSVEVYEDVLRRLGATHRDD